MFVWWNKNMDIKFSTHIMFLKSTLISKFKTSQPRKNMDKLEEWFVIDIETTCH